MRGTIILDGREYEVEIDLPTLQIKDWEEFKGRLKDGGQVEVSSGFSYRSIGLIAQAEPFEVATWDGVTPWPSAWIRRPRPATTSALAYFAALS